MYVYEHVKKLNVTPAYVLVKHALIECFEKDYLHPQSDGIDYDAEAVVAYLVNESANFKKPVGFIAYKKIDWSNNYDIYLAFVTKRFRGEGVHTAMYNKLIDIAKKENIVSIMSTISVNNEAGVAAAKKQGRTLLSNNFSTDLMTIPKYTEGG